jgi:hypothetical protein
MRLSGALGPRATVPVLAGAVGLMWGWVLLYHADLEAAYWATLLLAPLVGFAVAQGMRFRRRALLACVAVSPLVVKPTQWTLDAAEEYRWGGATIVEHRGMLYADPYPKLDHETRIPVRTIGTGCMGPSPDSVVVHGVRNTTLRVLTRAFGPMEGVYTGPLPTAMQWRRRFAEEGELADVPVDAEEYRDLDLVLARRAYHDAGLWASQVCFRMKNDDIRCEIQVHRDGKRIDELGRFVHDAEPFDAL